MTEIVEDGMADRLTSHLTRMVSKTTETQYLDGTTEMNADVMADALRPFARAEVVREIGPDGSSGSRGHQEDEFSSLTEWAIVINAKCLEHFPGVDRDMQQVFCLAEEVGEFVGAYRRWKGLARRSGAKDDMAKELADVVIAAYVTGAALGIDVDEIVRQKLDIIFTRGWRDENTRETS